MLTPLWLTGKPLIDALRNVHKHVIWLQHFWLSYFNPLTFPLHTHPHTLTHTLSHLTSHTPSHPPSHPLTPYLTHTLTHPPSHPHTLPHTLTHTFINLTWHLSNHFWCICSDISEMKIRTEFRTDFTNHACCNIDITSSTTALQGCILAERNGPECIMSPCAHKVETQCTPPY